jgi:DNA-binding transcriptional MerR regulator
MFYRLTDLINDSGATRDQIRRWRREGLMPPPIGRGRYVHWPPECLAAAKQILAIYGQNRTLRDIKDYLAPQDDAP